MAKKEIEFEMNAEVFASLIKKLSKEKRIWGNQTDRRNTLDLNERWRRYMEENEQFWRICLRVARSKPYLCAEAVEAEAVDIILGLKRET